MSGKSIQAVLQLNTVQFDADLKRTRDALTQFRNSMSRMGENSAKITGGIQTLSQSLSTLIPIVRKFSGLVKETSTFNNFSNGLLKMSEAVANLGNVTKTHQVGMIRIKEIMDAWGRAVNDLTFKLRNNGTAVDQNKAKIQQLRQNIANFRNDGDRASATLLKMARSLNSEEGAIMRVVNATTQYSTGATNVRRTTEQLTASLTKNSLEMQKNAIAKLRAMGYTGQLTNAEQRLANAEQQVGASSTQASNGINKTSASASKGTASVNRMTSATRGLGRTLSSLRMMGTMVASMMVYNFAHNLIETTRATVNAKSEMNGYFQMLGYTTSQVDSFNKKLSETVALFPRINKYQLGETISSIGVEFELTTKEMEKAMPVVSMITSEYLRAGRNVNEASLAVKDILQGQFQRLSRETGVKEKDLTKAGWSGDPKDTMGLLKALKKVGESRNWDTFVAKANSLNDAVLILQNRFGEWSADMVERVQPSIVRAFNTMMSVASLFSGVITGSLDWLSGDGLGQSIVKWGGLATAIGVGYTALVHYRTGANLTQIAQMGLNRSILASIMGLEAEATATNGVRTALVSKLTGIKAETVAENGRFASIMSVVSGLEAEEVKTIGATKVLFASVLGLDMATLKEYGFATALGVATTQIEAETFASKGLLTQIGLIAGATLPAIAVVGAFAVAFGSLVMKTMDATEKMSNFYDIQQNGKKYVEEARDSIELLKDKQDELRKTQKEYTKGSEEYKNVGTAIDLLNDKIELAKNNVDANYEALQRVNDAQKNFDTGKQEAQLDLQQRINQSLVDTGLSIEEANQLSNTYLNEAIDGSNQLYEALQSVVNQYDKQATGVASLTDYWSNQGLSAEEIKVKVDPYIDAQTELAGDIEKMKLSTDLMEVATTWLKVQYDQIKISLSENLPKLEAGDWEGGITGLLKGLAHGFADLPIFSDFWNYVFDKTGAKERYGGKGWAGLQQFLIDALWQGSSIGDFSAVFSLIGDNIHKFATDLWNYISDTFSNFFSDDGGSGDTSSKAKMIDISGIIRNLFNIGDGLSWAWTLINDNIITPLTTAWNNFMADPLGTIGGLVGASNGLTGLLSVLMPNNVGDLSWVWEWLNTNVLTPITTAWNNFLADPIGTLGGMLGGGLGVAGLLGALFPSDGGIGVWNWVNTNIITPLGTGISNGIASIPIVGDIASMLGLIDNNKEGADSKGYQLMTSFADGVTRKIGEIPIIGDIARMLGLIPQKNQDAHDKGQRLGGNIKDGEMMGHKGTADNVRDEMRDVVNAISNKAQDVWNAGAEIGSQIWNGINSVLDRHSPGMISREVGKEFGVDIINSISNSGSLAYSTAQMYGQQVRDGVASATNTNLGLDTMVGEYQTDAQTIATSSQMMGTNTTTAFNNMQMSVNQSTTQMQGNVVGTYSAMQTKQATSLNTMKTQNLNAYNQMYLKSNQSLLQMRDSTSNVTEQMVGAWSHMKNQIVATANKLKSDTTSHFSSLSSTIGAFYRKIQNPSNWGAGAGIPVRNKTRRPSVGRRIASRVSHKSGAGVNPYQSSKSMTLHDLLAMTGVNDTTKMDLNTFLSSIWGEHGFGWSGWNGRHYSHIKNTSDKWSMKPPIIMGRIPAGNGFKVGEFENGQPHLTWASFMQTAEALFSEIPYRFYWDSNWKGDWVSALKAGATNCSDGSDALVALAQTFGFDGYKQHTTTKSGLGHFYAIINGHKMDTTNFQNNRSWTPLGAGIPTRKYGGSSGNVPMGNKTFNITNDFSGAVIYGVDDLDSKIKQSTKEALQEEFNDPYSVTI